jgi:hypothetical protein
VYCIVRLPPGTHSFAVNNGGGGGGGGDDDNMKVTITYLNFINDKRCVLIDTGQWVGSLEVWYSTK